MDEAELKIAEGSDREVIMQMVETMRFIFQPPSENQAMEYCALAMTAATIFAGTNYGYAIAIGVESGDRIRRRQTLKMVERNFRAGIDIGLRKSSRIATEMGQRN